MNEQIAERMNITVKTKVRINGKSGDLLLYRRRQSLRRAFRSNNLDVLRLNDNGTGWKHLQQTEYTPFGVSFPQMLVSYPLAQINVAYITVVQLGVASLNQWWLMDRLLRAGSPSPDDMEQPFKFGGKELDLMHNLYYYDFHARMYDPLTQTFPTQDPLKEKYYSISPYAYCGNNPVNRVDPTGLTDYKINENGFMYDASTWWDKLRRVFTGPDKTDKLIAPNGSTLTMDAGTMRNFTDMKNNRGIKVGQSFEIGNSNTAEQVHEFLSNNVKRETTEYGVVDFSDEGTKSSVISWLDEKNKNNFTKIAQNLSNNGFSIIQMTHSHPAGVGPSSKDRNTITDFNTLFQNNKIDWRIYNPKANEYIYYNENGITKTVSKKIRY